MSTRPGRSRLINGVPEAPAWDAIRLGHTAVRGYDAGQLILGAKAFTNTRASTLVITTCREVAAACGCREPSSSSPAAGLARCRQRKATPGSIRTCLASIWSSNHPSRARRCPKCSLRARWPGASTTVLWTTGRFLSEPLVPRTSHRPLRHRSSGVSRLRDRHPAVTPTGPKAFANLADRTHRSVRDPSGGASGSHSVDCDSVTVDGTYTPVTDDFTATAPGTSSGLATAELATRPDGARR
jgi:hypothetical protein